MKPPRRRRTKLTALAKALRKANNAAQDSLWRVIRNRQIDGWKFRREFPIKPYIADFACIELNLVVELDGSGHIGSRRDEAVETLSEILL